MSRRKRLPVWPVTKDALAAIARIIGPQSAAAAALAQMESLEAEGIPAVCVRQGANFIVGPES